MKTTTRQRILDKAVELFNNNGFASVTLFEIAGALDMTRGNLTYHYKDKDALLQAISDEFWSKFEKEKSQSTMLPSFGKMHHDVQLFYRYQRQYSFIFMDDHVLRSPVIRQKFKEVTEQSIKEMEATIAFAIAAGNMHPEPYEGIYHNLAVSTWMLSFYWLNQQMILGDETDLTSEEGEKKIWSLLLPHLTERGMEAFRKYFGQDYLKKIGKSFQADIRQYVGF